MSYLLDALRKAERERRLGEVPDLGTETADGTATRRNGLPVWVFWLIGVVVAVNLGGMAAMWWAWSAEPRDSISSSAADDTAAMPAPPAALAVTADPVERLTPPPEPPTEPVARTTPEPAPAPVEPSAPSSDRNDDTVPTRRALPAAQQQRLPDLELNGLLYSSIPGRSFVLINGRRYHQGERTAAGPAVESIDEDGAILNHAGLRFRLPAPQ